MNVELAAPDRRYGKLPSPERKTARLESAIIINGCVTPQLCESNPIPLISLETTCHAYRLRVNRFLLSQPIMHHRSSFAFAPRSAALTPHNSTCPPPKSSNGSASTTTTAAAVSYCWRRYNSASTFYIRSGGSISYF
jgi:hypothetical protein